MVLMTITGISSEVWSWCHFRTILLGVGLVSSSHGFGFIHSGVEVLDVLWRVQARGVVVLVGHNLGAKPGERQSAPVVARANVFYLLQKWTENLVCQDILWVNKEKVVSKCVCERTRMLTETCNTCRANMTRHLMPLADCRSLYMYKQATDIKSLHLLASTMNSVTTLVNIRWVLIAAPSLTTSNLTGKCTMEVRSK